MTAMLLPIVYVTITVKIANANTRKRLPDYHVTLANSLMSLTPMYQYQFLMGLIRAEVTRKQRWVPNVTLADANMMFSHGEEVLAPIKSAKRRTAQLAWRSVVNVMRKHLKDSNAATTTQ